MRKERRSNNYICIFLTRHIHIDCSDHLNVIIIGMSSTFVCNDHVLYDSCGSLHPLDQNKAFRRYSWPQMSIVVAFMDNVKPPTSHLLWVVLEDISELARMAVSHVGLYPMFLRKANHETIFAIL